MIAIKNKQGQFFVAKGHVQMGNSFQPIEWWTTDKYYAKQFADRLDANIIAGQLKLTHNTEIYQQ